MSAFDLYWFLAAVAAFMNKTEFDQCANNARVGFIQNTHDVADGKMMIGEEVANSRLAFEGRIQPRSVCGQHE